MQARSIFKRVGCCLLSRHFQAVVVGASAIGDGTVLGDVDFEFRSRRNELIESSARQACELCLLLLRWNGIT